MDRRRFVPSHEGPPKRARCKPATSLASSGIRSPLTLIFRSPMSKKPCESSTSLFISTRSRRTAGFCPRRRSSRSRTRSMRCWTRSTGPPRKLSITLTTSSAKWCRPSRSAPTTSTASISRSGRSSDPAKAPSTAITGLQSALFTMVSQVDTASVLPVTLGSNDYTLTLQTALGIGRPMPPPIVPRIKKNQGIQAGVAHIKTPLMRPESLVGTYHSTLSSASSRPTGTSSGRTASSRTTITGSRSRCLKPSASTSSGFRPSTMWATSAS